MARSRTVPTTTTPVAAAAPGTPATVTPVASASATATPVVVATPIPVAVATPTPTTIAASNATPAGTGAAAPPATPSTITPVVNSTPQQPTPNLATTTPVARTPATGESSTDLKETPAKRKFKPKSKWNVIGAAAPPKELFYLWQAWFHLHTPSEHPAEIPTPPDLPRAPVSRLPGIPVVRRVGRSSSNDDVFLVTCESLRIFVVAEGSDGDRFGPTACRRIAIACALIGLLYHRHAPAPYGLENSDINSMPEHLKFAVRENPDLPNMAPEEREKAIASILKVVQDEWIKESSIAHQKQEEFQTTLSSSTAVHVLLGNRLLSANGKANSTLKKWGTKMSKTVQRLAEPSSETTVLSTEELIAQFPPPPETYFRDNAIGLGTTFSNSEAKSYAETLADLTTFLASCSPAPHMAQDFKEELSKTSSSQLMTKYLELCTQLGVSPERRENAYMMALALTCGIPMLKRQHRNGGINMEVTANADNLPRNASDAEADAALKLVLDQIPAPLRLLYASCCVMNKSSTYVMKKFEEVKMYARCGTSWAWWFRARYTAQKNRPISGPSLKRKRSNGSPATEEKSKSARGEESDSEETVGG